MLELSDKKFIITVINLKEKADDMQEQKRNVNRNVNSQKVWILAIKNTERENEECLWAYQYTGHNQRTKERISELEDRSMETCLTEMQRKKWKNKNQKTQNRTFKNYGTISRYNICKMEAQKENEKEVFEVIMTENFPKLMTNTKTIDPWSSDNIKQNKYWKTTFRHMLFVKPNTN